MTVIEIKTEIQKVLDTVPDEALTDVLNFLKTFQSTEDTKSDENFEKIIKKHRSLLTRLAQ